MDPGSGRSPHSCLFPNCLLQDPSSLQAADASGSGKSRGKLDERPTFSRKWCSCHRQVGLLSDKHFSPTGIGNSLPHSTPFSSTAQFPNSTVDSLANIFLTFPSFQPHRSIHRGATADVTFFPDESLWLPSRLLPLALGNVILLLPTKFFRTSPSPGSCKLCSDSQATPILDFDSPRENS